jgi:hypothetical protein
LLEITGDENPGDRIQNTTEGYRREETIRQEARHQCKIQITVRDSVIQKELNV